MNMGLAQQPWVVAWEEQQSASEAGEKERERERGERERERESERVVEVEGTRAIDRDRLCKGSHRRDGSWDHCLVAAILCTQLNHL